MSIESNPLGYLLFALIMPKGCLPNPPPAPEPTQQVRKADSVKIRVPEIKPQEETSPADSTVVVPTLEGQAPTDEKIAAKAKELKEQYNQENRRYWAAVQNFIKGCEIGAQKMAELGNANVNEAIQGIGNAQNFCANIFEEQYGPSPQESPNWEAAAAEALKEEQADADAEAEEKANAQN